MMSLNTSLLSSTLGPSEPFANAPPQWISTSPHPGVIVDRFGTVKVEPELDRTFRGGHKSGINSVCFSRSLPRSGGDFQVVSGGEDGQVLVWSMRAQMRPLRFSGHVGPVTGVAASPSGEKIASVGVDKSLRFWDNNNRGKGSVIKQAHSGAVRAIDWSEDGRFVLTCSDDKSVKLWNNEGKFTSSFLGHTNWVRTASISSEGTRAVSAGDDRTVRVWDLTRGSCDAQLCSFYDHTAAVFQSLFHPRDPQVVAAGGSDRCINLWDCRSKRPLLQSYKDAHGGGVKAIAFHPAGNYLVSAGQDGLIRVWDLREGRLLWNVQAHTGPITDLAFDFSGAHFASVDSNVFLWNSNLVDEPVPQVVKKPVPPNSRKVTQESHSVPSIRTSFESTGKFSSAREASPKAPLHSGPSPKQGTPSHGGHVPTGLGQSTHSASHAEINSKLDLILGAMHGLESRLRGAESRLARIDN